jgi:hypothetical protein
VASQRRIVPRRSAAVAIVTVAVACRHRAPIACVAGGRGKRQATRSRLGGHLTVMVPTRACWSVLPEESCTIPSTV